MVATALLGNDDELKERVKAAGEMSQERVWEMPLWEEYHEQIKSDIADIKNVGSMGGGTITAACFLSKFTEDYPWAHLDIAGTSVTLKDKPYTPKGGTGVGVRLMVQLLQNWTPLPRKKK